MPSITRSALLAAVVGLGMTLPATQGLRAVAATVALEGDGIVTLKSAYDMQDTIDRLKADIADKGIVFFFQVDQSALAGAAGIQLQPTTQLNFGNPALGSLFITARPEAGLDWPVRVLVSQDDGGQVWVSYTDFAWIAARHGITDRDAEFAKATEVITSIAASVAAR
ncbi:DUF302 domain-containing protein [Rhodobacteraceae bacterium 2CG4]|uniref:DUF302 domain-containing protein n=1 Tax=Halovulum marinum TaxID=2662447 RepID=A0A6L5YWX3_9RHOB|nr:DUF302 domain-containing protein [Halovulum marinum]MSU88449.1 DUF302 domain-containing protein [Halovulum marinum]